MEEKGCNGCQNHGDLGNGQGKLSDSGSAVKKNHEDSGKISFVLIASLLICCVVATVAISAGAGLMVYSVIGDGM